MRTVTIIHPFTPQAAGVVEHRVPQYHSQPHAQAMQVLAQQGFQCEMAYFTPKWFGYTLKDKNIDYHFYPVTFTLNGDHKKWKKQTSKSCYNAFKKQTPDVTIINMSGHSSPFSYKLSKLILKQGKQYIAMLGGRHYSDKDWVKEYYKNAHHIIVHTKLQKLHMQKLSLFDGCELRVMPLGVDTGLFQANERQENSKIQLLYVGRVVELKRIHLAIEVVVELVLRGFTNVVLKIVGPVYSKAYQQALEQLVIEKNLAQHISFEGFKEHATLVSYYRESDLLLLPSESESFGMVVVESMSCGVPVAVIAGVTGPEEMITHNVDGLISSLDNYVTEVADLVMDSNKLDALKKNARQKVLNHYSMEATNRVLLQSVKDALE